MVIIITSTYKWLSCETISMLCFSIYLGIVRTRDGGDIKRKAVLWKITLKLLLNSFYCFFPKRPCWSNKVELKSRDYRFPKFKLTLSHAHTNAQVQVHMLLFLFSLTLLDLLKLKGKKKKKGLVLALSLSPVSQFCGHT